MYEIGRLVMKVAGRDANRVGVIVDTVTQNTVLIDGQTRRRTVNVAHIEPLRRTIDIKKGASSQDVAKALGDAGFPVVEKKNSHGSATRQIKRRAGVEKLQTSPDKSTKKSAPKKTSAPAKAE